MSNRVMVKSLLVLMGVTASFSAYSPVKAAETCQPFRPLGGTGYEVRKSVS